MMLDENEKGNGFAKSKNGATDELTGDLSQYSEDQLGKKLTKRQQNIIKNIKNGKGQPN